MTKSSSGGVSEHENHNMIGKATFVGMLIKL
jgi:hypothetical protein